MELPKEIKERLESFEKDPRKYEKQDIITVIESFGFEHKDSNSMEHFFEKDLGYGIATLKVIKRHNTWNPICMGEVYTKKKPNQRTHWINFSGGYGLPNQAEFYSIEDFDRILHMLWPYVNPVHYATDFYDSDAMDLMTYLEYNVYSAKVYSHKEKIRKVYDKPVPYRDEEDILWIEAKLENNKYIVRDHDRSVVEIEEKDIYTVTSAISDDKHYAIALKNKTYEKLNS